METLLILLVVFFIWYISFRASRKRLYELAERIHTLPSLPIIGHAHYCIGSTREIVEVIKVATAFGLENYGKTSFWLGPYFFYIIANPDDAEVVLNKCLEKDTTYKYLAPWLGKGLLTGPLSTWKGHRKVLVPTFGPKLLDSFLEKLNHRAVKLSQKIQTKCGAEEFDIFQNLSLTTLDVLGATMMGLSFNSLNNPDTLFVKALRSQMFISFQRMYKIWLRPNVIFSLTPMGFQQRRNLKILHKFTQQIINDRKREYLSAEKNEQDEESSWVYKTYGYKRIKGKAFLDHMIEISENSEHWTDEEICDEVDTLLMAGFETTAHTMGYALTILGTRPDIQNKAIEELREIFGDSDRPVEKEDLSRMEYLERIIKETLRLFPSAPLILRKPNREIQLGKDLLPKETSCIVNILGLHRNAEVWGTDVLTFNPDRFLRESHEKRHQYSYIPFSGGPRGCLGKQFAMMSMKTIMSTLLRAYVISSTKETKSMSLKLEIVLKPTDGHFISINKRSSKIF